MHPLSSAMKIDINNVDNYDNIRRRSHSLSNISSRSVSVILKSSSRPYYKKIVINNNLPDKEFVKPVDSSQLSYNGNGQERNYISMITDSVSSQEPQCVSNKTLALNTYNIPHVGDDDVINIQLPYNPDQHTEPEL